MKKTYGLLFFFVCRVYVIISDFVERIYVWAVRMHYRFLSYNRQCRKGKKKKKKREYLDDT